jgi:hypothetical protein
LGLDKLAFRPPKRAGSRKQQKANVDSFPPAHGAIPNVRRMIVAHLWEIRQTVQNVPGIPVTPAFLEKLVRTTDSALQARRQGGKEARHMARKAAKPQHGSISDQDGDSPAKAMTVKVTLHLTVGTAQRLGIESAMRRVSQSAIAEEVLAGYLSRWQLPAVPDPNRLKAG